jgi:SlyX protein
MSDAAVFQSRADERITELEIKLSYTEDLLDTLNALVARQQQDISMLLREVVTLRQQGDEPGTGSPPNPRDELPPHY